MGLCTSRLTQYLDDELTAYQYTKPLLDEDEYNEYNHSDIKNIEK